MDDVGRGPVGIDTAIVIYYIEEHPEYFAPVSTLSTALDQNRRQGVHYIPHSRTAAFQSPGHQDSANGQYLSTH